jgi:hypothetical protein
MNRGASPELRYLFDALSDLFAVRLALEIFSVQIVSLSADHIFCDSVGVLFQFIDPVV